jgi:hypothetical protein
MKTEQTECSEMSAYKIKTPENYPEENIQHGFSYYTTERGARKTVTGEVKKSFLV